MDYKDLSNEDFDAVVTGELTHLALWFEEGLNEIIEGYFVGNIIRKSEFRRLLLYREGLNFQDKIEIVRGMLPLLGTKTEQKDLKDILKKIEEFKSWRNAMAHGIGVPFDEKSPKIIIEIVSRAGKEKVIEITPESHKGRMKQTKKLLVRLNEFLENLS